LTHFLSNIQSFAAQRSRVLPHEFYATHSDHVPVSITKVITAPWGYSEPITIPESAQVELYWQLMPGELQKDVEAEFFAWLRNLVDSAPEVYPAMPSVDMPIRWMPGSFTPRHSPIVQHMARAAKTVLDTEPVIAGIEGPCDLFIIQDVFGIPAVIWGAKGGNTHGADEYVEIDSLIKAAQALLLLVADWCGEPSPD
jgi:acetylornithine deacetylase